MSAADTRGAATRRAKLRIGLLTAALALLAAPGAAPAEDVSALVIPEQHTVAVLPPAGSDRVYVLDMVFSHPMAGMAFVVDGAARVVAGTISAGFMPHLVIGPGHRELFVLGSYWSRGVRGERTDVVTYYDPSTLAPVAEVVLPPERFLIADKSHNADLTPDGRYLLSTNMTPATSVSVVDVPARRFVGTIETPGCTFVFPSAPNRFSSLCADGSLFTATFDEAARAEASRSEPFFDVLGDPLHEHGAIDRRAAVVHFVSYGGQVHTVDLSQPAPRFAKPWPLQSAAERGEGWRPGGWDLVALHRETGRLFVLMNTGGKLLHKEPGSEVWVFDVARRKRVQRIALEEVATSIAVSQGATGALLYTIHQGKLSLYDAASGEPTGTLDEMGNTSLEIVTYDR